MAYFEFYLSNEDTDRLFALKKKAGKKDLTGNEYARMILETYLHKIHPATVIFDEDGNEIE